MKSVAFRVDAGLHIGMGHLMRCLALATELKKNKAIVFFITKSHLGADLSEVEKNFEVIYLPNPVTYPMEINNNYESWLGTSVADDLIKTNEYLAKFKVDLTIIDHYALNASYERELITKYVMAVDDLFHRIHYVKFLLNQNLGATQEEYKDSSVEEFFLGPEYSLLRSEFGRFHSKIKLTNDLKIKKILVFFGFGDVHNNCLGLAQSLSKDELQDYQLTFILNKLHPDYPELLKFQKKYQSITILSYASDMAKLMADHDFFIGAGGTTSWERAALGVPSAIICLAENQKKICNALSREGWSIFLGDGKIVASRWHILFRKELQDYVNIGKMRSVSFNRVDGKGAERVAKRILDII